MSKHPRSLLHSQPCQCLLRSCSSARSPWSTFCIPEKTTPRTPGVALRLMHPQSHAVVAGAAAPSCSEVAQWGQPLLLCSTLLLWRLFVVWLTLCVVLQGSCRDRIDAHYYDYYAYYVYYAHSYSYYAYYAYLVGLTATRTFVCLVIKSLSDCSFRSLVRVSLLFVCLKSVCLHLCYRFRCAWRRALRWTPQQQLRDGHGPARTACFNRFLSVPITCSTYCRSGSRVSLCALHSYHLRCFYFVLDAVPLFGRQGGG